MPGLLDMNFGFITFGGRGSFKFWDSAIQKLDRCIWFMTLIRAQPCVTRESRISLKRDLTYILCIYISHLFTLYKYISLIVLVHIIQTYIYILCESVNLYIIPTYVMLLPTVINFPSKSPGSICAKNYFYPSTIPACLTEKSTTTALRLEQSSSPVAFQQKACCSHCHHCCLMIPLSRDLQ